MIVTLMLEDLAEEEWMTHLHHPLHKAFDPNQPRDAKGQWSSTGAIPDGGMKAYLEMVTVAGGPIEKFILEHGRAYPTDDESFIGGTPKECYKNAALAVINGDQPTYVEGYVSVHGVPIHHAWTVNEQGVVRDVTLDSDKSDTSDKKAILGYYGVPIKKSFLTETLLGNKIYGVTTHNNAKRLLGSKVEDVVKEGFEKAFDPNQPRDERGQWTDTGSGPGGLSTAPGRPPVTGKAGQFMNRLKAGVDAIPPEHAVKLQGVPIEVREFLPHGSAGEPARTAAGLFSWDGPPHIEIGQKTDVVIDGRVLGQLRITDPEGTVVHELGHALDHQNGWALGRNLSPYFTSDSSAMKPEERTKAAYWLSDRKEMFAEIYRVAYSPNKKGRPFGMTQKRAEKVFASSLTKLKGDLV